MLEVSVRIRRPGLDLGCTFKVGNEVLAVLGPSGSGKTTLLRAIAGLERPAEGEIRLHGRTLFGGGTGEDLPPRLRRIGFVFQEYALFPHLSVEDNLYLCQERRDEDAVSAILETFHAAHLRHARPSRISGGEKQRVALARALLRRPDFLLLDEPFSSLDQAMKRHLYREFLRIRKAWDVGTILVTHDEAEAQLLADKVLEIREGTPVRERHNHLQGTVRRVREETHYLEMEVEALGTGLKLVRPDFFAGDRFRPGDPVALTIRPEDLLLFVGEPEGRFATNHFPARVEDISRTQRSAKIRLRAGTDRLVSVLPLSTLEGLGLQGGDAVTCVLAPDAVQVLNLGPDEEG